MSCAGNSDITEKPVDPVKVYSEKELIREVEKIASTLVPDKDWSLRIGAMQRVEGLVMGGLLPFFSFYLIYSVSDYFHESICSLQRAKRETCYLKQEIEALSSRVMFALLVKYFKEAYYFDENMKGFWV